MSENAPGLTHGGDHDRELIPRALIRACVFLVLAVTALVAFATYTDRPKAGQPPAGKVVAERLISVEIQPRGAALIFDETGTLVHSFGEGEAGFMDSVFRALSYERKRSGADLDGPVTIARMDTGRHVLIDPNTGWAMQLIGYGANNIEPFVQLLSEVEMQ
ncbi:MAG: photosynthetic complex assembly protein PuhC [Pseudomonadota bacterium]